MVFPPIPTFSPELFSYIRAPSGQRKAFQKALEGLLGEGAVQVLYSLDDFQVRGVTRGMVSSLSYGFSAACFNPNVGLHFVSPFHGRSMFLLPSSPRLSLPRQVDPILAAVGELQYEVVLYRMKAEYGVDARLENLPFQVRSGPGLGLTGQAVTDTFMRCLFDQATSSSLRPSSAALL